MILQELFQEYGYTDIQNDVDGEKHGLFINYFYDSNEQKPSELLGIYLSKNMDELFIVLKEKEGGIKELCNQWDKRIRDFMVFGAEDRNTLQRLKYNVVQIVVFKNDIKDGEEEFSLNISRKIFLRGTVNSTGQIDLAENEELEVPFFMIRSETSEADQSLIDELREYMPDPVSSLNFLYDRRKKANRPAKSFTEVEYDSIKEWLSKNENN